MATFTEFTTAARVKESLFPGDPNPPSTHDSLIASAIAEVTSRIRYRLDNREISEETHTERLSGAGTSRLVLRHGPLVSVTSVACITYTKNASTGAIEETSTAVPTGDYLLDGKRDDGWTGRGVLLHRLGRWASGIKNYEVVYVAGFNTVPEFIQEAATNAVLLSIANKPGVKSLRLGDYRVEHFEQSRIDEAIERAIFPLADLTQ